MIAYAPVDRMVVTYHPAGEPPVRVGELGYRDHRALFEYDAGVIDRGLELSPFHLPLARGVQRADPSKFEGLFGLFDDSLPDGWGRLLLDRYIQRLGRRAAELTPLDRLAWVGHRAIGALSYEPIREADEAELTDEPPDLHRLAEQAKLVLEDRASVALPELLRLGGSPQGARPKALILLGPDYETVRVDDEYVPGFTPYLVKFPARSDPNHLAGAIEYAYSQMAKEAGLNIPDTRLLAPRGAHKGYFAIERFDRRGSGRVHVQTASALLSAPPGASFLSYEELLRLTWTLAKDAADVEEMFRRAAFNVYAHNRDDHARNFAFMMEPDGDWRLAPAYDITFSDGPAGEHTTTVAGEGRAPKRSHLEALAKAGSIKPRRARQVLDEVQAAVGQWAEIARAAGISKKVTTEIGRHLLRDR